MPTLRSLVALTCATLLPCSPAFAQGHQVTPKITDYFVVKEGDAFGAAQYVGLAKASVARVGTDFDVAFWGAVSTVPGKTGVFVDQSVTTQAMSPFAAFLELDQVDVPNLCTNVPITLIDSVVPPAISSGGHVAQTVKLNKQPCFPNMVALLRRDAGTAP